MDSKTVRDVDRAIGRVLATSFVLLLIGWAASLVPGLLREDLRKLFAGLFLIYTGAMFLASYRYSERIGFLRGFMWVCTDFSRGRHRMLAFFYFGVCTVVGIAVLSH